MKKMEIMYGKIIIYTLVNFLIKWKIFRRKRR